MHQVGVVPIYDVLPKSFRYVDAFFEAYELFSSTKDLPGDVGGGFHQGAVAGLFTAPDLFRLPALRVVLYQRDDAGGGAPAPKAVSPRA